jgi:antitoxin PrlF
MIASRMKHKGQTTIPRSIRAALNLTEGAEIAYQIDGDRVILSKAQGNRAKSDRFSTFWEWDSAADNKAYAKLKPSRMNLNVT